MCGKNLNIVSMCAVSPVVHTSNITSCQKYLFSFSVAMNNSIKVGPLVFLLYMFVITENIMKCSVYRVEQEECARLREGVPYVRVYRYNPKHLYPKLNGLGDNGQ